MNPPFDIDLRPGWSEVTGEGEVPDYPWTYARPDGVGAFQVSLALYEGGKIPNATAQQLLEMLCTFGSANELGEPFDIVTNDSPSPLTAASFRLDDMFVRAWYLTDGSNFAMATYTCDPQPPSPKLPDCEVMVRTIRFKS